MPIGCWSATRSTRPTRAGGNGKSPLPPVLYSCQRESQDIRAAVNLVHRTGQRGLERRPYGVRSGGHSGYQAVNLAYHFGAKVIILIGYDLQPSVHDEQRHHMLHDHPNRSHVPYGRYEDWYADLRDELARDSVLLINATRHTAIPVEAVERMALDAAILYATGYAAPAHLLQRQPADER
jgi:hypothetical protein